MSKDIIADVLNQVMNAQRAKKNVVAIKNFSKLLINVLDLMKKEGYLDYKIENGGLVIDLKEISECRAIKPRYTVNKKNIEKYIRRFLPSRNFGFIIISTNRGLMTHQKAKENNIGGNLIAYFY